MLSPVRIMKCGSGRFFLFWKRAFELVFWGRYSTDYYNFSMTKQSWHRLPLLEVLLQVGYTLTSKNSGAHRVKIFPSFFNLCLPHPQSRVGLRVLTLSLFLRTRGEEEMNPAVSSASQKREVKIPF